MSTSQPAKSGFRRLIAALGASVVLHLIVVAAAMPSPPAPEPSISEVELITLPPEVTAHVPETPRVIPRDPVEEPAESSVAAKRPLLASLSSPRSVLPPSPQQEEPRPPEEVVEDPSLSRTTPLVVPWLPSPRETAKRQVLLDNLPPLSDRDRVEARVQGIMDGALPQLPNDQSPMPTLETDGEGNLVHRNGALVATIRPDGTVDFDTSATVTVDGFGDERQDDVADMHTKIPSVPIPITVTRATEADCMVNRCHDKAGLGATFRPSMDLNDLALKARGEDPLAARQRRFLRLTEELRDGMADRHRKRSLSRSRLRAGRNLERIWSDETLAFAQKRRMLFRLWDECEEAESDDDERPEAAAGQRARRHILQFIRQKLPPEASGAFTPAELQRMNSSRRSAQTFAPYE